MRPCLLVLVGCALILLPAAGLARAGEPALEAGFGEADVTPEVGKRPVFLAGFGHNRLATGVHDPLRARAVVLRAGPTRLALVSVDVVGLFHPLVERVRRRLPAFRYVLVSSTHNHEGPDTLGLWGPTALQSGVDPDYLALVERRIVEAVQAADRACRPATARLGTARAPELLHDAREPYIKHDEVVVLELRDAKGERPTGLVVQWNCHPETLGGRNTLVTADFVGPVVQYLRDRHRCPVVYLSGTVGGLMTSLEVPIRSPQGKDLANGTFAKAQRYGELLGQVLDRALASARRVRLTPLEERHGELFLPVDNKLYLLGWRLGVFKRQAFLWSGDPHKARPAGTGDTDRRLCVRTEIAWLRLGQLEVAAIPGEIYPELVLSKVQDPPDPGADFPEAPIEPGIYRQLHGPYHMLIGLANDEIGYIIPKRQWDEKPPFCYGRKKSQYGEANSLGPDTAPLLCRAFQDLVAGK